MCKQLARWLVRDRDEMMYSFSCTAHLPQMVSDTTESIERTSSGGGAGTTCDYLEPWEALAEVMTIWLEETKGIPEHMDVFALVEAMRAVLQ